MRFAALLSLLTLAALVAPARATAPHEGRIFWHQCQLELPETPTNLRLECMDCLRDHPGNHYDANGADGARCNPASEAAGTPGAAPAPKVAAKRMAKAVRATSAPAPAPVVDSPPDADGGLRTPADCAALKEPLAAECVKCVSDIKRHHFHPNAAAGARCQFDAGGK